MGRGHASAQLITNISGSIRSHVNLEASYTTILKKQHFHHSTKFTMPSYIVCITIAIYPISPSADNLS